jgi:ribonucleases P/MRP protein subunit RPP40
MTFNASKTTQLIVSHRKDGEHPNISFQGTNLSSANSMKLLGVTFTDQLSLDHHVNMKLQTASRMLGVLYRLRHVLPLSSMLQLYKALIRPHFEYCSNLLDSASLKIMELIEKLQKKAMRILGCVDPLKENIFPLSHRRDVGSLSLLYRYFHGRCSYELHDLVPSLDHRSSSTRQCHSMHEFTLSVPRSRTSHHQKSFSLGWFVVGILFLVQYFQ